MRGSVTGDGEFPSYSWERIMESESKIEVNKGLKTPEVDQESDAVKTYDPSTNGYSTELSKDLCDKKTYKSATSGSSSDDTFCRNTKPPEAQPPLCNVESTNKLNTSSFEEPQKFMNTPEWASMSYSEKSTFLFFLQAGVSEEEAISIIDEVRQERGIPELTKQHRETESTHEHSKDVIPKDDEKVKECNKESTIEVSRASDVTNNSDVVLVSSSSDEDCNHESANPNSSEYKQRATPNSDGATINSKWVRHSDCKHTLEELKKMAQQILTKKSREQFVYKTYCRGFDTNEQMKLFLDMDANKPRVELRKMSKILPKNLRSKFYREAMRRNNPNALMRKFMSVPQNQQWLLCKKLKLSNTKLLYKLFQIPDQKSRNPVTRPLKEWFNIFLQEGSVDEAIGKVKNLILHGAVTEKNTAEDGAPNAVASENQSPCRVNHNEEVVESCRQLGRKSRSKRNKRFQQLNEDQMKVYNSWLEQGLSHQDALTIVLRFPGDRRSARMNVCAWGECDKHPQQKFSKSEKTVTKAQPCANGTHPSVSSGTTQFKKPIFDRIPVPSIVVDTCSPPKAGLPLEQRAEVPSVVNNGKSITPFGPHGSIIQSEIPPLAMSSQGPRVPQKSKFVDKSEPLKPAGLPKQDPSTTETLHLCIVPSGYPKERFSDEEFKAVENSIRMAISGISDDRMKPIFIKQFRNEDKYEMVCQDQLAKKWLHKYVACMYPVVPLKIIPAKVAKITARAVLPLCKNDDTKTILGILARQNQGLNVSQWEVVNRSDSRENTSLKLLVDKESANVLKICSEVGFMMGIANIGIEDPKQMNSKINSGKSGTRQVLGASRSTVCRMSQADKGASASESDFQNIQKEQQPISANKQKRGFQEPNKHLGSHGKLDAKPSEKNLLKKTNHNSQGPHKNQYVGKPHNHEYRDNREQDTSDPMGNQTTIPSSSKQNIEEPNVGMLGGSGYPPNCFLPPDCGPLNEPWYNPNCHVPFIGPQGFVRPPRHAHPPGMPPRFAFPPFMPPRFARPPGMPPRFAHPPGMPPRFPHPPGMPPRFPHPQGIPPRFAHPPGMPPRFAQPLRMPPMYAHCGVPPSDGFPLERSNQLEQITEKSAPRSPSPDFDELLKNARTRLNLPDEPALTKSTDAQKSSSSEQVHSGRSSETQPIRRKSTRSNERNDSSKRIPAARRSYKRNHSPEDSSYSSRSVRRKHSRSSPPLRRNRSTKSSRWN